MKLKYENNTVYVLCTRFLQFVLSWQQYRTINMVLDQEVCILLPLSLNTYLQGLRQVCTSTPSAPNSLRFPSTSQPKITSTTRQQWLER